MLIGYREMYSKNYLVRHPIEKYKHNLNKYSNLKITGTVKTRCHKLIPQPSKIILSLCYKPAHQPSCGSVMKQDSTYSL